LLQAVDTLLPSRKKDAVALAQKYSETYGGNSQIGDALRRRHKDLAQEIQVETDTRRSQLKFFLISVSLLGAVFFLVSLLQKASKEVPRSGSRTGMTVPGPSRPILTLVQDGQVRAQLELVWSS